MLVLLFDFLLEHEGETHMSPLIENLLLVAIVDGGLAHPGTRCALERLNEGLLEGEYLSYLLFVFFITQHQI